MLGYRLRRTLWMEETKTHYNSPFSGSRIYRNNRRFGAWWIRSGFGGGTSGRNCTSAQRHLASDVPYLADEVVRHPERPHWRQQRHDDSLPRSGETQTDLHAGVGRRILAPGVGGQWKKLGEDRPSHRRLKRAGAARMRRLYSAHSKKISHTLCTP